jgi:hypothetical protein
MALSGIPIDPQQCIGDSLIVLNDSFIELDSRTLSLSSNDSILNAAILALSSNDSILNAAILALSSQNTSNTQTLTSALYSNFSKLKFTATGGTTYNASSLIGSQTNAFLYKVDINGVSQEPGINVTDGDFYLSGGNLFFSTAPISGTKIVIVGPQYI